MTFMTFMTFRTFKTLKNFSSYKRYIYSICYFSLFLHEKKPHHAVMYRVLILQGQVGVLLILQLSRKGVTFRRESDSQSKCVGSKLRYHTHMAGISYT